MPLSHHIPWGSSEGFTSPQPEFPIDPALKCNDGGASQETLAFAGTASETGYSPLAFAGTASEMEYSPLTIPPGTASEMGYSPLTIPPGTASETGYSPLAFAGTASEMGYSSFQSPSGTALEMESWPFTTPSEACEKNFCCSKCRKKFNTGVNVRRHIRSMHAESDAQVIKINTERKPRKPNKVTEHSDGRKRPYACPVCPSRFLWKKDVKRHMRQSRNIYHVKHLAWQ